MGPLTNWKVSKTLIESPGGVAVNPFSGCPGRHPAASLRHSQRQPRVASAPRQAYHFRFFWRVLDRGDYWLTQARLWLAEAIYDPEP